MKVRGLQHLTAVQLEEELARGGRFVFYEYCISLIVVTLRRPSAVYFVRAEHSTILPGIPYILLSLLLGWWGLPWGIVYTPVVVFTNLCGGCDVTAQLGPSLLAAADDPACLDRL